MRRARWLSLLFWIDGVAALGGGAFVLFVRHPLADLYRLPLALLTFIGFVNVAYALVGLSLRKCGGGVSGR